ncbi:MAG TPA: APC family permease [Candidatus Cybelea sp.]|jgi:amino acid transporter|nr:APC family permease [Candidatus Cybelea sp.]
MELRRSMRLFDVVLFFVVAGSNLQWVATAAAAGPSSIAVWVIGCLAMFVPVAIAVVFLSSHYPDEGGLYVWSKRAFGPLAGFVTGWTYWASNLPYFPALLYFAAGNALFVDASARGALATSPWYFIAFALCGLALATVLNVYGLSVGKWLTNVGGIARWSATVLLVLLGAAVWWRFGSATHFSAAAMRPGLALKDVIFWSVIAFAWTGPEASSFMGGEIRNPRRTVPAGLALAAPAIAVIYIAGTLGLLAAAQPQQIDSSVGVMDGIARAAARFAWNPLVPLAALFVAISCLGSTGAWLGAVARIPFVAGIDRYLPPVFGRMHPRWGSPVAAIVTQAVIAAIFIFLGQANSTVKGAYDVLVSSTVIATMIPFVFLFAAAFKFRGLKAGPGEVRIPGGALTVSLAALVGLGTTIVAIVLAGFPSADDPDKVLEVVKVVGLTLAMLATGLLIYALGRRRAGA